VAHVDDRWVKNGKRTARYGKGLRYRSRYLTPDGGERSRSFAQLLDCIAAGPSGGVTLTFDDGAIREPGKHYEGAVLRIEAANRTLVYRITQWLPWYLGCIAEWPD
jgi:hypothetical protein